MEGSFAVGLISIEHVLAELFKNGDDLGTILVLVVYCPSRLDAVIPVLL